MMDIFVLRDVEADEWEFVCTTSQTNFADIAVALMSLYPDALGIQIVPAKDE
jgi:hypothetical protein